MVPEEENSRPPQVGLVYGSIVYIVTIIGAIIAALVKENLEYMKILAFQSTVLCWLLGLNHLISLLQNFSLTYIFHILGVFEVLLLGGLWGTILLCKSNKA